MRATAGVSPAGAVFATLTAMPVSVPTSAKVMIVLDWPKLYGTPTVKVCVRCTLPTVSCVPVTVAPLPRVSVYAPVVRSPVRRLSSPLTPIVKPGFLAFCTSIGMPTGW